MFPGVGTGAENIVSVAFREIQLTLLALALHPDKGAAGGRLAYRLWLGAGGKKLIERHHLAVSDSPFKGKPEDCSGNF